MSEIKKIDLAYEDERGIILDIFESEPKDHGALITFNSGAVRANHYHKLTTQFTFLISGTLKMRGFPPASTGAPDPLERRPSLP